jgi:chromosome segregation protein
MGWIIISLRPPVRITVRLNSIKLSGFKSFAEPTNFILPSQLVGVVGPNGCGKSNIMDAVRWVLGESRASELRGESMQDVIFNGTSARKPASRASVELVFDNSDHRAGGQWGKYAEVAVKRVLTRDGTSSYYINNQPVRRRDVHDVFLGTGLGPRAYAIIGQGTITRIIESKPEELRLFLEEAAGVSKYKERRRETEHRLSDTRENLTRVQDILRELNAQLEKLERQAEVAEKFNALQREVKLKQHQFWYLRRAEADAERSQIQHTMQAAVTALDAQLAELRRVESELESIRQAHYAAGDEVNLAQGKLYEASSEVGRLEAEIRFVMEGRQRVQERLTALVQQVALWSGRSQEAQHELEQIQTQTLDADQASQLARNQHEQSRQQLPEAEHQLQAAHNLAQAQRQAAGQIQQQLQVLAAEQRSDAEQMRQLDQRRERLSDEQAGLPAPDPERLAQLEQDEQQAQAEFLDHRTRLQALQDILPGLDEKRRQQQERLSSASSLLAEYFAKLEALKALQDQVKVDGKLQPWLNRHGLSELAGLWTRLQIESGWEQALESALRERMGALEVGRLELISAFEDQPPPAKLAFYTPPAASSQAQVARAGLPCASLSSLLRLNDSSLRALLTVWLHGCYVAGSMQEALALRPQLQVGEAIYLATGHCIALHSVSLYAQDSEQAGLLARAQDIEKLQKLWRAQTLITDEARHALTRAEAACAESVHALTVLRHSLADTQSRAHQLQMQSQRLNQQAEQTRNRGAQIDRDVQEVDQRLAQLRIQHSAHLVAFEALDQDLALAQEQHMALDERVAQAQTELAALREHVRTHELASQRAEFAVCALQTRIQELTRSAQTAQQQLATLVQEEASTRTELAALTDVAAQAGLQTALAVRLERERLLGARRSAYDDLTGKLRAGDERRQQIERSLEPMRQKITDLQLKEQAARLCFEQFTQLLEEAKADPQQLAPLVAEQLVRPTSLQTDIERIHRELAALGAVNLAALEELTSSRERQHFLDTQSADLAEAMTTLEDAIRKIDIETRDRLGATFQTVNGHFGRMFPELFGGGQAKLIMTGDEILDSGVQVMAQPPGKKNQTIQLLSGGEKALTAIALVFAIFQLNPAPFCLLDEVDAPLDDSNTERYCKLVSQMSQSTQFLFISHNKITMETAQQLIGVTMQELGVSRIVAVDMDAAVSMVDR